MRYHQCRLVAGDGHKTVVGWIEERGAIAGASVEMKEYGGERFVVTDVYEPGIEAAKLHEKQVNDRNSLSSISGPFRG